MCVRMLGACVRGGGVCVCVLGTVVCVCVRYGVGGGKGRGVVTLVT